MKKLTFKVDGQYITRTDHEKPVAKCRHLYRAEFEFTGDEWTGVKTALFANGNKAKSQVLDEKNTCEVPWEFFDTDTGTIGLVSVFCGDLTTANSASVYIAKSGYVQSDASVPPTPDVYQQLIETANETKEIAQSVRDDADAGKFRGEQGPMGPTGARGEKGDTGTQGPKGETGPQGEIGKTGESAYQTAVKLGFKGTEQEWIESLKYDHSEEFANLAEEVRNTANGIVADRQQIQKNAVDIESLGNNKADAIVSTASGEQITLTDSDNELFKGLHVYGKSTQVTTKGVNLFDIDSFLKIPIEQDNFGRKRRVSEFRLKPNTKYTLSTNNEGTCDDQDADKNRSLYFSSIYDDTFECPQTAVLKGKGVTVTSNVDGMVKIALYDRTNSKPIENKECWVMLNEGDSSIPFEPYTGGKSSPSIEYPQEITSSGDKGDISIDVFGGNLLNITDFENADVKITNEKDVIIVEKKTNTSGDIYRGKGFELNLTAGKYVLDCDGITGDSFTEPGHRVQVMLDNRIVAWVSYPNEIFKTFTLKKNSTIKVNIHSGYEEANKKYKIKGLRINREKSMPFEPYKEPQTLTIPTPNGLPGIPVTTGGNYTDETGQQWVTDEIDFGRGKYIQKLCKMMFDGSPDENIGMEQDSNDNHVFIIRDLPHIVYPNEGMCNMLPYMYSWANIEHVFAENLAVVILINKSRQINSIDKFRELLKSKPLEVLICLKSPIERDLTPEEIQAYKELHTNYPTTVIMNDENAGMKVSYVADIKHYIDKKFKELNQAIVNTQISLL